MKEKRNVRYLGFRPATEGGRLFDFCISAVGCPDFLTSFEIPAGLFTGGDRIRLQEGVGICYAKLKGLLEGGPLSEVPNTLCLTASDLAQYRELVSGPSKRRAVPQIN